MNRFLHCLWMITVIGQAAMAVDDTSLVAEGAKVIKLGGDMKFTEGPVWLPDQKKLIFSDIPNSKWMQWTEDSGVSVYRPSEQANGNILDLEGRLISCQHQARNLVRIEKDGEITVLADRFEGQRFNSPNDVAVRSDGTLWFTDPPWGLSEPSELPGHFVFKLDPQTGKIEVVIDNLAMPNGIVFSPDETRLYVADTGGNSRHPDPAFHELPPGIHCYEVSKDGQLGKKLFTIPEGSDGLKVDAKGNLYTTHGNVKIYDPAGKLLEQIDVPEAPANLCFGGDDYRTLFITARTSLYSVRMVNPGVNFVVKPADSTPTAERDEFEVNVLPFFNAHCLRCHDDQQLQGDFRLDTLAHDFGSQQTAERWAEVLFRINSGEMPPMIEPQPKAEELGRVSEWISQRLKEGEAARMSQRGPVTLNRLSRDEYSKTVHDLLGVHFDPTMPGALNDDPRWHGFDRIGAMLTLSPSHVERYLRAADTILQQAFPEQQPVSKTTRQTAPASQRWLIYPSLLHGQIQTPTPGLYRIRVQLSGLASFKGRLPRLSLWNSSLKRAEVGQDVLASEDAPTVIEFESFLPQGSFQLINEAPGKLDDGPTPSATPTLLTRVQDYRPSPIGYKLFLEDARPIFPLLLVDWYECEGPIVPEADLKKREGFFPASISSRSPQDAQEQEQQQRDVRDCLSRFMARAWRRPPTTTEVDRLMAVFDSERQSGENPRSAYLAAMAGVLASRNFYYLVEGSADAQRERINDWELASRLSYFLWSSLPDDELSEHAARGELRQPEVLRQQVQRMLADSKSSRFLDSFPQQWLQLHRVGQFPPDPELYPDYDKWLERSMVLESTQFFGDVFTRNASIREFLTSDWTMLNARLAMHYGMNFPLEAGFHRVPLTDQDHRGGLLTQAAVLSLTSDGTRHRPVHRGVWVSEAIFGRTPPPPPPNVEPLEPTPSDKPKATIRDQLHAHATHATCASCHRKIDPLGFSFENYDAIGRWRIREQVQGGHGEDPPVDARGVLPNGRAFNGPDEFKKLLAEDLDQFAEAFTEQLATYALRRVMTIDDADSIRAIAAATRNGGFRLRLLIENLILSDLFQKR